MTSVNQSVFARIDNPGNNEGGERLGVYICIALWLIFDINEANSMAIFTENRVVFRCEHKIFFMWPCTRKFNY